jgi:hypothetical protein
MENCRLVREKWELSAVVVKLCPRNTGLRLLTQTGGFPLKLSSWFTVAALLVFTLLATMFWPNLFVSGRELPSMNPGISMPRPDLGVTRVTIPDGVPLLGGITMPDVALFAGLIGVVLVPVLLTGFLLHLLMRGLGSSVSGTVESADYQTSRSRLDQRAKDWNKQQLQAAPPNPMPDHSTTRWSAFSSAALLGFTMLFFGAAISYNFFGGANALGWALGLAVFGWLIGAFVFNTRSILATRETDLAPVRWSELFIWISGIVLLGAGLGLTMWVRSGGG